MKKLNKAISLLLAVVLVFGSFGMTLTAFATESGGNSCFDYTLIYGSEGLITECDKSVSGEVTVPAVIDGNPVYYVDEYAFLECTEITGITVEKGVQYFDVDLSDCNKLTYVSIPTDAYVWGIKFPFANCSEITLSAENVVLKFDRSKKTTTVNIGADVVDFSPFEDYMFMCTEIDKINVDSANKNFTVVDGVLYNADVTAFYLYPTASTKKSYVMPDTVGYTYENASYLSFLFFAKNLESITIGKNFNILYETAEAYDQSYAEIASGVGEKIANFYMAAILGQSLMDEIFLYTPNLKEIKVSPDHKFLTSKDGVLCLKDANINYILVYPGSKDGDVVLNDNDMVANTFAFTALQGAHKLSISDKCINNLVDIAKATADISGETLGEEAIEEVVIDYFEDILLYTPVSEFYVSPTNPYFSVDEKGVLYNKDKTDLIKFPPVSNVKYWEVPEGISVEMTDFVCVDYILTKVSSPENTRVHMSKLDVENGNIPACAVVCLGASENDVISYGGVSMTYGEFVATYNEEIKTQRASYAEEKAMLDKEYEQGKITEIEYKILCNELHAEASMYMPIIEFCNGSHVDTFSIQQPSRTEIRNRDGIVLHTSLEGTAPKGSYVKWEAENDNFEVGTKGDDLLVVAKNKGWTKFTAILCAEDGTELARAEVELYSKSGFFDKIGGFFRSLFGATKVYDN